MKTNQEFQADSDPVSWFRVALRMRHGRGQIMRIVIRVCYTGVLTLAGCRDQKTESGTAKVEESESSPSGSQVVRLAAEVQQDVGLVVTTVRRQSVTESLETTGWLQVIPGSEWNIRAPASGYLMLESESQALAVGQTVEDGQEIGRLQAFVSPVDAVQLVLAKEEADIAIGQAAASLAIAEEQLQNLVDNEASRAIAGTRLQQLRETAEQARVAIREAKEKLPFLPAEPYEGSVELKPISLTSSRQGMVTAVHAVPRHFLVQGDPIYNVADWKTLWLKVPLYEVDYHRVRPEDTAAVMLPGQEAPVSVQPVTVPASMLPGSRTMSRYYRIENPGNSLKPGQPLVVSLPTGSPINELLVPRSALVWDGFGNAWVYVRDEETTFRRARVETGSAIGNDIVIRCGLEAGAEVVTTGTQTLYGEEFRGQIQTEDDD